MMSKDVNKLERLYLDGKGQVEQFKVLFDDVVPSRAIEDRKRLVGMEMRTVEIASAPERPHTANVLKLVKKRAEEWAKSVNDVLDEIGKYRLQFNDPQEKGFETDKTDLAKNEKGLFKAIDDMASRVVELRKIIVSIETNNEQPRKVTREQLRQPDKNVIYELAYNSFKGELTLNGALILTPRLDSTPDKAFQGAFKSPNTPIKIEGGMSSTIGNLKIPPALKEIMFRCSKGAFQVNPTITEGDLLQYGINKQTVDQELQKLIQ